MKLITRHRLLTVLFSLTLSFIFQADSVLANEKINHLHERIYQYANTTQNHFQTVIRIEAGPDSGLYKEYLRRFKPIYKEMTEELHSYIQWAVINPPLNALSTVDQEKEIADFLERVFKNVFTALTIRDRITTDIRLNRPCVDDQSGNGNSQNSSSGHHHQNTQTQLAQDHETGQEVNQELERCQICKRKFNVDRCQCGKVYCARHMRATVHDCTFDYSKANQDRLREQLSKESTPDQHGLDKI